jgi:hypothetical protein
MYSGVNLDSFIKKITFQEITPEGLQALGPTIEVMAENEHLDAHRNAVTVRLKSITNYELRIEKREKQGKPGKSGKSLVSLVSNTSKKQRIQETHI